MENTPNHPAKYVQLSFPQTKKNTGYNTQNDCPILEKITTALQKTQLNSTISVLAL